MIANYVINDGLYFMEKVSMTTMMKKMGVKKVSQSLQGRAHPRHWCRFYEDVFPKGVRCCFLPKVARPLLSAGKQKTPALTSKTDASKQNEKPTLNKSFL